MSESKKDLDWLYRREDEELEHTRVMPPVVGPPTMPQAAAPGPRPQATPTAPTAWPTPQQAARTQAAGPAPTLRIMP